MEKVIPLGSWNFDVTPTSLVKVSSRGLVGDDRRDLIKRSGSHVFANMMDEISFHKDEIPIHAIAIGATEGWGFNRNGDAFKEATCRDRHHTFVSLPLPQVKEGEHGGARIYLHHANKDPHKSLGYVKAAAYNEPMRRIELLLAGNLSKAAADRNGGLVMPAEYADGLSRGDVLAFSMACFTDPQYPILVKDRGYVGIADVRVGDEVWTHKGRWRRVTELRRRQYSGELFTFEVNGLPLPLELTATHPMWAKVFAGSRTKAAISEKSRRFFRDPEVFEAAPADWVEAKDLGVGDRFFHQPVTRYTGYGAIGSTDLATLMGYYVAEGSFGYNGERANVTQFTCNLADSAVRAIPQIIGRLWPDITVQLNPKNNSEHGISIDVFDTEFSEFLRQQLGRGCKHKVISPEIFNSSESVKLAFLGAWLDGDGWLDKKGAHWSSSNVGLVLQGRDLLASLGMPASIYKIDHANCVTSGHPGSGKEYTLNLSHLDSWRLAEWSQKTAEYPTSQNYRSKPSCMRHCPDGRYALRIKRVASRFVSDVTAYNFEVEEDESYSAAGLISHNCRLPHDECSICHKHAAHRGEYCTRDTCVSDDGFRGFGCRDGLTKVAHNGRAQYVENPNCTFFDFSIVGRPADRTAYGAVADYFSKAASHRGFVMGGAELAEKIAYQTFAGQASSELARKALSLLAKLASCERDLESSPSAKDIESSRAFAAAIQPAADFRSLGLPGTDKLAAAMKALAERHVLPTLSDFVTLVSPDVEATKVAECVAVIARQLPGIYQRLTTDANLLTQISQCGLEKISRATPDRSQRLYAEQFAETRSLRSDELQKRATLSTIRGCAPGLSYASLEQAKQANAVNGAGGPAIELARQYALLKLAMLCQLPETSDLPLTLKASVLQNYCC